MIYATLDMLGDLINLYDFIEDHSLNQGKNKIQSLIKTQNTHFLVDTEDCLAYVIICTDGIELILRKTRGYEKIAKQISELLE